VDDGPGDVVWEIEEAIAALVERMRERDARCFWAVGPSSTPAEAGEH
jgi:hypothetical protein